MDRTCAGCHTSTPFRLGCGDRGPESGIKVQSSVVIIGCFTCSYKERRELFVHRAPHCVLQWFHSSGLHQSAGNTHPSVVLTLEEYAGDTADVFLHAISSAESVLKVVCGDEYATTVGGTQEPLSPGHATVVSIATLLAELRTIWTDVKARGLDVATDSLWDEVLEKLVMLTSLMCKLKRRKAQFGDRGNASGLLPNILPTMHGALVAAGDAFHDLTVLQRLKDRTFDD